MSKDNIKLTCKIAITLFLIFQVLNFDFSAAVSYAVSIAAVLDIAYDRYLWRFNPLEKTPKVFGTYKTVFYSSFNGGTVHPSTIVIKQSLSHIFIYEECGDGYSESITASVVQNSPNGQWHLYYTYVTHPNHSQLRKNDDPHHGTAILCIKDRNHIEGTYFTNRITPTGGDLTLERIA